MTALFERFPRLLRLRRRFVPAALILVYHRVAALPHDLWEMSAAPERFEEQLQVLSREAHPLRLAELVRAVRAGKIPRRSVVITFDDGYLDNLQIAKPLLLRYGIPATFFISTGYLAQSPGGAREFWWDELERILLTKPVPERLALRIGPQSYVWEIREPDGVSPQILCRTLWGLLYSLEHEERREVLAFLRQWAGASAETRPSYRPLTVHELVELARGSNIEMGAHTINHSALAGLPPALQYQEIAESKRQLEDILDRPVTSFSYPFGRRGDYTDTVKALVRDAGFLCACCNQAGVVERDADPFALHRLRLQELDGDRFAQILNWWFDG